MNDIFLVQLYPKSINTITNYIFFEKKIFEIST